VVRDKNQTGKAAKKFLTLYCWKMWCKLLFLEVSSRPPLYGKILEYVCEINVVIRHRAQTRETFINNVQLLSLLVFIFTVMKVSRFTTIIPQNG
jgi:hypothetical protein